MPNPKLNELFANTNVKPKADAVVTEVTNKSVEANIISAAESKEQAAVRGETGVIEEDFNPNYVFSIERGTHKLDIKPEKGATYNYFASCSCGWQGRFIVVQQAEAYARKHVFNFPRRG